MNETFDLEDARPEGAGGPALLPPAAAAGTAGSAATGGTAATGPTRSPGAAGRSGQRAMWFGIAGFTAIVTIAVVGLPQLGWLAEQTATTTWTARHAIAAVDVEVTGGDLLIRPSGGADVVSLRQSLTWTVNKPRIEESWQGDRLVISEDCAAPSFAVVNPCGASLELAVPAGVSVQSTVDSGSLAIRRITGNVTAQAQAGDIELDEDSGALWARAGSGSVSGIRLTAAQVNAQTLSGDVDLDFAVAPASVSASVASGEVTVNVPRGSTYRVTGQTSSGDRQIETGIEDESSPRQITLDSQSGDVTLGYTGPS